MGGDPAAYYLRRLHCLAVFLMCPMPSTLFRSNGYQIIEDFLLPDACAELLKSISTYYHERDLPEIKRTVKGRSLHYKVISGQDIKRNLPKIWDLYSTIEKLVREASGESLVPLADIRAAVNVNIMARGGEYRWHYDRNAVAAVLYLNDVEAGETELYPRYRILLRNNKHATLQKFLDRLLMTPLVRTIFGKRMVVSPKPGRLLLMRGDKTSHSVCPVRGDQERVCIVFSFDVTGAEFPMEEGLNAYLYTQEKNKIADPNYIR